MDMILSFEDKPLLARSNIWLPKRNVSEFFLHRGCYTISGIKLMDNLSPDELGIQHFDSGSHSYDIVKDGDLIDPAIYKHHLYIVTKPNNQLVFDAISFHSKWIRYGFFRYIQRVNSPNGFNVLNDSYNNGPYEKDFVAQMSMLYNGILENIQINDLTAMLEL